jgi:hypothetical protein
MSGFRSLGDDEEVEFECKVSDKGLEATSVTGPEGADCSGSHRRPVSKKRFRRIRWVVNEKHVIPRNFPSPSSNSTEARCSLVLKALGYKAEGRRFENRWGEILNLSQRNSYTMDLVEHINFFHKVAYSTYNAGGSLGKFLDCYFCNCLSEIRWEGRSRSHFCKPIISTCHVILQWTSIVFTEYIFYFMLHFVCDG